MTQPLFYIPLPTLLQMLLHALLRHTMLLSLVVIALLALRRPIARFFGPGLAYASWIALPLLLVVAYLPVSPPAARLSAELILQFSPTLTQAPALDVPRMEAGLWTTLALTVWVLGALTIAARMVWLQRRFGASLAPSEPGTPSHWIGTQGPALVGLWPARLVLPPDFEQRFDARQRPLVLAHEDVHRRRFDNHWNALAAALCALNWFNPLAWLALRAMRADQELSCDHAVMRDHPGHEADYGRALLLAQASPSPLQPWSGWRSAHPLIERVAMLAVRPRSRSRRLIGALALSVLALGAGGAVHAVNAASGSAGSAGPAGGEAGSGKPGEAKGELIALEMIVQVNHRADGGIKDQRLIPQLRLAAHDGERALIVMGGKPDAPTPDQVRIEAVPRRVDARHVLVSFDVSLGGKPLVKRAAIQVEDGVDAGLQATPDGDKDTEVLIRVRTLPASAIAAVAATPPTASAKPVGAQ